MKSIEGLRPEMCARIRMRGVASYSCSVTRHLPPDSYMLTKNKIETDRTVPRDERITAGEMTGTYGRTPQKAAWNEPPCPALQPGRPE